MQGIIDQILDGELEYEAGSLDFSCPRIEITLREGDIREDSFFIYGPENSLTEGYVCSTRQRVECLTEKFAGAKSEIAYRVNTQGMGECEKLKGEFCIISNQGEYSIPYVISTVHDNLESSMGEIKNLFHFANLAKANWAEAVRLFYSQEFKRFFEGVDKQHYGVYRGLSRNYGNEQNVEEFILQINKKQKMEYLLRDDLIQIDSPRANEEYTVVINRNGWGHTELKVEQEGDFLLLQKNRITENDFLGNLYRLPFYLNMTALHSGRNFGRIHLSNPYVSLTATVQVNVRGEQKKLLAHRQEKKRTLVQLVSYYEAFRTKKLNAATWLQETDKLVEKLSGFDEKDLAVQLYRAQLLITQERYNEAKWMLDKLNDGILRSGEPDLLCYYYYLTTLYNREEAYIDEAAGIVEKIYTQNKSDWRIAWLLLYLSEDYSRSPSKRFLVLEEQFQYNCCSPILYIEAWHLMEMNPSLLMKLENFELQVLHYAVKKKLLTAEIVNQVAYLAGKQKNYSNLLFRILCAGYEVHASDEVLQVICTMLIKAGKVGEAYFPWYQKGVEREQRITRLYEYYMMSVPVSEDVVIPKIVLMYFAFDSILDYTRNSFLYAYAYQHQEEFPELYASYKEQIERFVVDQIGKGHINKWLAFLYKKMIVSSMITGETAEGLARILFTNRVQIRRGRINRIVVIYDRIKEEECYPVVDDTAYLPLYGNDYTLLLEDKENNRYCLATDYSVEKLLIPDKLAMMIAPLVENNLKFDVWLCQKNSPVTEITVENAVRMKRIAASACFERKYQWELRMKLVRYYYEQDQMRELDTFLEESQAEWFAPGDQAEIIRFLVLRGMQEKAYEWIHADDCYGVDPKIIVRLCTRLLEEDEENQAMDQTMLHLVYQAFNHGKYNETLLRYLVKNFNGSIKEMRDVWSAATSFGVDTYELCQRMLIQMLYTGSFVGERIEIFKTYIAGGAKSDVETAFLARCAYDYFCKEAITDEFVIRDMLRVIGRKEELARICKLAFVKYYAEHLDEIDEEIKALLERYLQDFLEEKIYFPFYKEYLNVIDCMEQFADKTMIEYRTCTGGQVMIHYLIERDDGMESEYAKEAMHEMYQGIYVQQFILFFGERLQYYITETTDENEHLTESGTLSRNDMANEHSNNKYNMINDMAIGKTLQDYNTVNGLLLEYYKKEFMRDKLFHLYE